MIDALEAVLFYLLERRTSVAASDLCTWDEQRAERVMAYARMHQHSPGLWSPTAATRQWSRKIWAELRVDPASVTRHTSGRQRLEHRRA